MSSRVALPSVDSRHDLFKCYRLVDGATVGTTTTPTDSSVPPLGFGTATGDVRVPTTITGGPWGVTAVRAPRVFINDVHNFFSLPVSVVFFKFSYTVFLVAPGDVLTGTEDGEPLNEREPE